MSQTLTYNRPRSRRRSRLDRRTLHWRMATTPAVAALIVMLGTVGLDLVLDPPADDYAVEPLPEPAPPPPLPPAPAVQPQELVAAATAAVEAWGRFASTGDLTDVAETFVADGPQLRQLEQETPARHAARAGPPYRFSLFNATVLDERPDGDRVIRGAVELSRDGSPTQHFRWDFRLRQGDDGVWRVWTVSEAAGG